MSSPRRPAVARRPFALRRGALAALGAALLVAAVGAILLLPGGDASPTDAPLGDGPYLVYAEFGALSDTIYVAPADAPSETRRVGAVEHAEGWGLNPARNIAGSLVAYTVLPQGAPARNDAPAELWVHDLLTNERTRLASDADLLAAPVLGDGALVYRSSRSGGRQELVRVDLESRARTTVHVYEGGFGVYPIGFDATGELLYAMYSTGGTDIHRAREGEEAEHVLHASDEIARDWQLSPDGRLLSYLAPEQHQERVVHRVQVVDLDGAAVTALTPEAEAPAEQFSPVWTPDGDALTTGREAYPGPAAPVELTRLDGTTALLEAPQSGFDVPLGWSDDARYLAARSFSGRNAYEPGNESLVLIGADGRRSALETETELLFLGWMQDWQQGAAEVRNGG